MKAARLLFAASGAGIARILGSKDGLTSLKPVLALVTTLGSSLGTDFKKSGDRTCSAPSGATVTGPRYAMFVSFAVFYFPAWLNAYPPPQLPISSRQRANRLARHQSQSS